VGIQRPYKGTDALLSALVGIEDPVLVLLGGECPDPGWRHRLETLGAQCGSKARVRLRHLDDAELDRWLSAADVAVFPFREVTNSSSVLRALGAGVPVLVPDLEEFSDLPSDAVFRYEPGVGLGRALRDMIGLPGDQLALRAAAAVRFAQGQTWAAASAATMAAYAAVLRDGAVTPADAAVQPADAVIVPIRSSGATVRPTDAAAGTVGESVAVR
jgi:glycosyltransferase involved in cell wall biosynthesis